MEALTAEDEQGLALVGFLTFADRPKADAGSSIAQLERLGVEVKIITGDNGLVAAKVCSDIGVDCAGVLSGTEVESLDDDHLEAAILTTTVFARISPDQKSRIIKVARRTGKDVAFLGDGVNDAVALHHADVGISVDSGTDVAKDAADVVLLDKDLGVLAEGVMEGRRIFANTMKYVLMSTSSNFGNMFSAAGASVFLSFLPMLPTQILLNNLLYNAGQLVIPTDRVDPEALARPAAWDMKFIRRFMSVFGPVSSIFDFLTFWVMLSFLHAGHIEFRTGWFVESIATQTLVIYVIRTRRVPFFKSRPSLSDAAGADRGGSGRCRPAVHGAGPPAGLHTAADDLLPSAVRRWSSSTCCWSSWRRPGSTAPPMPGLPDLPPLTPNGWSGASAAGRPASSALRCQRTKPLWFTGANGVSDGRPLSDARPCCLQGLVVSLVVKALSCLGHRPHMREFQASHQRFCGGGDREGGAGGVGSQPTDPCRSHDFQSCRFGRSRTPPTSLSPLSLHLLALYHAVAGFCATGDRESSQGRKAAALSGFVCVPQGTWLLRTTDARATESAPLDRSSP